VGRRQGSQKRVTHNFRISLFVLTNVCDQVPSARRRRHEGSAWRLTGDAVRQLTETTLSLNLHPQIVLSTCHTAGGKQLRNYEFDVVIIDEATQAMEAVRHHTPTGLTLGIMIIDDTARSAGSQYSKPRS